MKTMGALLALYVGIVASISPAFAHSDEFSEALRRCAEIEQVIQRLACYDGVLRPPPKTSGAEASPVKPSPSSPAPPFPVVQPAAAVPPSESDTNPPKKTEFGLKAKRPEEPDSIDVVVVRAKKNLSGKFVFTTQDGQVWLQIDSRSPNYHDIPFEAHIRKASLGSFFIVPGNSNQAVRVSQRK